MRKEKPGTPPQLHASTPLCSEYQEAPDEQKEQAAAKPSSDMTMSLFKYEEVKSEEAFDGASMHKLPMIISKFEHKSVQCDLPPEDSEIEQIAEDEAEPAMNPQQQQIEEAEGLQPKEQTNIDDKYPQTF